jgi:hypothetical protein
LLTAQPFDPADSPRELHHIHESAIAEDYVLLKPLKMLSFLPVVSVFTSPMNVYLTVGLRNLISMDLISHFASHFRYNTYTELTVIIKL